MVEQCAGAAPVDLTALVPTTGTFPTWTFDGSQVPTSWVAAATVPGTYQIINNPGTSCSDTAVVILSTSGGPQLGPDQVSEHLRRRHVRSDHAVQHYRNVGSVVFRGIALCHARGRYRSWRLHADRQHQRRMRGYGGGDPRRAGAAQPRRRPNAGPVQQCIARPHRAVHHHRPECGMDADGLPRCRSRCSDHRRCVPTDHLQRSRLRRYRDGHCDRDRKSVAWSGCFGGDLRWRQC